ncbi:peptidase [Cellulomonas shaoxiangyii]|uniref:Peptidase n=1 Tax=Cellulomonas shaoxiangyii TaxID=2566013 RepID=A0A4P7SK46_9CELL|nr:peptidase [Cellulomonas shaoxiangyii]QCB94530.1 peptidase [Cellulomonas shaoxiangyii]TGY78389.1 peptidase [Cellulomonas shaoxiangyii]
MRHTVRAAGAAALLLASVGVAPSVASATPAADPAADCTPAVDEYGAPLPCEVRVEVLSPVCDADVPKLRYALTVVGAARDTVDVTWVNPDGEDVVQADQPLSGTVPWPGAVVDAGGRPVDWPGWRLEGGTWVQGDEYDWVRPEVTVRFDVNPAATVTVAYPPSSPVCLTAPPRSDVLAAGAEPGVGPGDGAGERSEVLAATGAQVAVLAAGAAGLVALGMGAVALRRRRQG